MTLVLLTLNKEFERQIFLATMLEAQSETSQQLNNTLKVKVEQEQLQKLCNVFYLFIEGLSLDQ